MNTKLNMALCAGTMLGALMFAPTATFARDNDRSSDRDEVIEELREELEDLREELREARQEAREELHEAREDRHTARIIIDGDEREMTAAERREFDRDMAEFEREMEEFGREMGQLGRELGRELSQEFSVEFANFDLEMEGFAEEMAEFAVEMAGLEGQIMAELEASGIRIESDDDGNETVWLSGDSRGDGDADMRIVSTRGGDDLIYFYFDGFDEDYSFIMEDGEGDDTIIHAYDTDAVNFETSRRHDGNVETDLDSRGRPQLTVITRDTDDYRVVQLNRRRFN